VLALFGLLLLATCYVDWVVIAGGVKCLEPVCVGCRRRKSVVAGKSLVEVGERTGVCYRNNPSLIWDKDIRNLVWILLRISTTLVCIPIQTCQ
jgi:hypothetical protein